MNESIWRHNGFRFQILTADDISEIGAYLTPNFMLRIPLVTFLQPSYKNCLNFVISSISSEKVLKYSIKIVHEATNELAGAIISASVDADFKALLTEDSKRCFDPLYKLLDLTDRKFFEITKLDPSKGLLMYMGSIHSKFEGNKLLQQAMMITERIAAREGFTYTFAEAVAYRSQRSVRYSGYKVPYSLDFKDFQDEGYRPYAGLDGRVDMVYKPLTENSRL